MYTTITALLFAALMALAASSISGTNTPPILPKGVLAYEPARRIQFPLHEAIRNNNVLWVQRLLLNGVPLDTVEQVVHLPAPEQFDSQNPTTRMMPAITYTPLSAAIFYNSLGTCSHAILDLIASRSNLNRIDSAGHQPLHYAMEWGNLEAIRLFLLKGASANALNAKFEPPIKTWLDREKHFRSLKDRDTGPVLLNNYAILKMLIANGTSVADYEYNITDEKRDALVFACQDIATICYAPELYLSMASIKRITEGYKISEGSAMALVYRSRNTPFGIQLLKDKQILKTMIEHALEFGVII